MTKADVAIYFEESKKNSLGTVGIYKEEKYQTLKTHYEEGEYPMTVQALVYGSLAVIAQEKKKVLSQEHGIREK